MLRKLFWEVFNIFSGVLLRDIPFLPSRTHSWMNYYWVWSDIDQAVLSTMGEIRMLTLVLFESSTSCRDNWKLIRQDYCTVGVGWPATIQNMTRIINLMHFTAVGGKVAPVVDYVIAHIVKSGARSNTGYGQIYKWLQNTINICFIINQKAILSH
jgi:hypothetical protein